VGIGIGIPLAVAVFLPPSAGYISIGILFGLAGLATVIAFERERLPDLLFLGFIALSSVSVDKYFGYRLHEGGWPGVRVAVADVPLLIMAGIAVAGWLMGRFHTSVPRPVLASGAALLAVYGLSVLAAPEPVLASFELASTLHAFAVGILVAGFFRREYIGPILALVAISLLIHTAVAGAQVATGRPLGLALFGGPEHIVAQVLRGGETRLRPSGLFVHPIVYANFVMLGLPIVAVGLALVRQRWARLCLAGTFAAGTVGIVLTLSRGAWISFAFAMSVLLALAVALGLIQRALLKRIVLWASLLGVAAAPILGPIVYERFTQSDSGALNVRFELNDIAMRMIAEHPITGVGLNSFLLEMADYDPKNVMEYFPATVHNLYLLEAAEVGIPGLLAFSSLFVSLLWTSWRRLRRVQDLELAWLAAALLAGLAGLLLSQVADFSHRIEPLRTIAWTYIGLLLGILRVAEANASPRPEDAST
jgi:O-antigen ligase